MSILLVRPSDLDVRINADSYRYSEKRKAEAERIRQKYPDRIPVRLYLRVSREG